MQETIPQVYKVDDLLAKQEAEGIQRNGHGPQGGVAVDSHPASTENGGDDKRIVSMPTAVKLGAEDEVPLLHGHDLYEPVREIRRERPEHREICIMAANGFTTKEIADHTGWSEATVMNVKRQPWAQEYIVKTMEKCGRKVVMNTLQGKALESAQTLIDTMQGNIADTKMATVRAKAANDILDRCFGTATNVTISGKVDVKDIPTDELAAIAMGRQN